MKRTIVCISSLVLAVSVHAQIAQWTFETSLPSGFTLSTAAGVPSTSLSPEIGSGSAFGLHSGASFYTSPAGNGSLRSFSSTNWAIGDYYQFSTSTLGFSGIAVDYDQISSSTGPGKFALFYSTDGTSWTQFGPEYTVLVNSSPNTWSSGTYNPSSHFSYDLSAVTALDNATTVYFRLQDTQTTSAGGATVATGGTDRVDNFTVSVVPEPATCALLGLGFAALLIRRKSV